MSGYFARIKALENDLKIILQNLDSGDRIIPGMKASGDSVHAMLGALRELKLHLRTDDYIAMSEIPSLIYSLNKGMKEFFVSINKLKSLPEVKSQYDKVSKTVESGEADKELKDSLASLKKFLNSEDKIIETYSSYYLIVKKILNIFRFIQISE
ncbi:hypothetical protein [Klebsiella phage phiKp_32]|nr:hypothetical protein [Klebsiella phage phiKp_32]